MGEKILGFNESLADHYRLIFDDWNKSIWSAPKVRIRSAMNLPVVGVVARWETPEAFSKQTKSASFP